MRAVETSAADHGVRTQGICRTMAILGKTREILRGRSGNHSMQVWMMNRDQADAVVFIDADPEACGGYEGVLSASRPVIDDGPVISVDCADVSQIPARHVLEYDGSGWLLPRAKLPVPGPALLPRQDQTPGRRRWSGKSNGSVRRGRFNALHPDHPRRGSWQGSAILDCRSIEAAQEPFASASTHPHGPGFEAFAGIELPHGPPGFRIPVRE